MRMKIELQEDGIHGRQQNREDERHWYLFSVRGFQYKWKALVVCVFLFCFSHIGYLSKHKQEQEQEHQGITPSFTL